ncbi:DUF6473 family protein [uncultured Sulfitobacter sp.]|uniref:DUF6473 family protein n=1 Tax=uncultured Sulfitobacter sp. TaxID=191468 RepID=UPI0026071C42|nr:DUF6473 family protein [uncultured Sulfitobacter sp.]
MTYDVLGPAALDYMPCRYGTSKLVFRGPRRVLDGPYIAFLGGTQTFGKFIEQPFPLKVEHLTGVTSVNFGQINAGPDVFLKEAEVLATAQAARATVLEVLGAANMSNLFYAVHPRRNDRFLHASGQLKRLYPDVDFTQFNFTQHMLTHLHRRDGERFVVVQRMLQRAWMRKMRQLLPRLGGRVVLLRIIDSDRVGPAGDRWVDSASPAFVSDNMLEALAPLVNTVVDVLRVADGAEGQDAGLIFHQMEADAVRLVAGPSTHSDVARALLPVLDRVMK